jgi:hypothetical protein
MKTIRFILRSAIVTVIAILATLAFAAPERHRDDQRVTVDGHVRAIHHERDGYRVELDKGGYSFWVPENALRNRNNDFRVGVSVRLGGIFRGGVIIVDAVEWPPVAPFPSRRMHDDMLRGTIERIDARHATLLVREERSGRLVHVDVMQSDHDWTRPHDFDDLRRGDVVVMSGDWTRGRDFNAYRIEDVHARRW